MHPTACHTRVPQQPGAWMTIRLDDGNQRDYFFCPEPGDVEAAYAECCEHARHRAAHGLWLIRSDWPQLFDSLDHDPDMIFIPPHRIAWVSVRREPGEAGWEDFA